MPFSPTELGEPLAESAPLMWRQAQSHCRPQCRAYHGAWQYLRLLGVITSIRGDGDYFIESMRRLARDGELQRVLISGAADYGTLAHVLAACRAEDVEPEVTVVDLCRTPLWNNAWYSQRLHACIQTVRSDILAFEDPAPFDLICTHSFLGRFDPAARARLLARWHELLRPGGWVLTSKRVRPGHTQPTISYDGADADTFVARLRTAALSRAEPLGVELDDLLAAGRDYVQTKFNYNLRSADELRALFEASGFEMVDMDTPEPFPPDVDRPSVVEHGRSRRVRLLARRPL